MEKPVKHSTPSVLISGGSGIVGRYLTSLLLERGYKVAHLSRGVNQFGKVRVFRWDPEKGILDPEFLKGVDYLVHLAGAHLDGGPWTKRRRRKIYDSRVKAARLLYDTVEANGIGLKAFISASGVGYYGSFTSEKIFREEDPPGAGFLGSLCREWEETADLFGSSGVRTVKLRTAPILEKTFSGLSKLIFPVKFGIVLRLGAGSQYMPWIHISDLSNIYLRAIEDESFGGVYNAVAPQHVTHEEFMRTLAKVMKRPVFLPSVPSFVVKAVTGELGDVILKGSRVLPDRILKTGYQFTFSNLRDALTDIVKS